jgi:hypothetical protein
MSVIDARQYADEMRAAERRRMWVNEAVRLAAITALCIVIIAALCATGVCK